MSDLRDPLPLAQALRRCASVTPADGGAQDALADMLAQLGFTIHRLRFGEIENLFARRGTNGPHICFAGHTDVVPVGAANWRTDPFGGEVRDGVLHGRGACDMKGAIAAFVAGVAQYLETGHDKGSISFLITGDEEGPAIDGTVKILEWMQANGQVPDFCLVGEPTCPVKLGDMVKIGRRGSVNMKIEVFGTQGHVAYPHRADNPVHRLLRILDALTAAPVDAGTDWFEPSTLQVTSVDVGNPASNVIPAEARAVFNIRFNDRHTGESLKRWLAECLAPAGGRYELDIAVSGEAFLTPPGPLSALLCRAIEAATGRRPALSTTGGTSDARFIKDYCPVVEFGMVGQTMHKVDEHVPLADVERLAAIYERILDDFFA